MSKGSDAPQSSTGGIQAAQASTAGAEDAYQRSKDTSDWAIQQGDNTGKVANAAATGQLQTQSDSEDFANQEQNFYGDNYIPLTKDYTDRVKNYDTPAREEQAAGAAEAGVGQQFEQARAASQQHLESFGIDPSSTRYAAMDLGSRTAQAAAQAGAGTKAVQDTQKTAMDQEAKAVSQGNQMASNVNTSRNTGTQAGTAASQGVTQNMTARSNAQGTPVQWSNAGTAATSPAVTATGNYNQSQSANYSASQSADSGAGSAAGAVAGALISKFAGGGAIPDRNADTGLPQPDPGNTNADTGMSNGAHTGTPVPQSGDETPGGGVPAQASPSGGDAVDDVPAKLTAGEFVIPKDAVAWLGQRHFYDTIMKARKEKATAGQRTGIGGKPAPASAIPQRPTFESRPQ